MFNKKLVPQKKISVYLRNHDEGPSCFYRVVQYIKQIDFCIFKVNDALSLSDFRRNMDMKGGIKKNFFQMFLLFKIIVRRFKQICVDLIEKPDVIVIQREVFPRLLLKICAVFYKKILFNSFVVWDFDDSILLSGEISKREWKLLLEHSDCIVATSDYLLKDLITKAKKIKMPTTDGFCDSIDLVQYMNKRKSVYNNVIKLVWVGTHSNLHNVVKILPQLDFAGKIIKEHGKKLELHIVCNIDTSEMYFNYKNINVFFSKWTRKKAEDAILNAHIGLMPIPDNDFAKGKGGFKLVQYIASGIPVVGSNVGFNKEIISENVGMLINEEKFWCDAVVEYGLNYEKWEKACVFAQSRYVEKFSFKHNLETWKKILNF